MVFRRRILVHIQVGRHDEHIWYLIIMKTYIPYDYYIPYELIIYHIYHMMARTDENHLISGFQPGGLVHRIPQPSYTGGCSHQRRSTDSWGKLDRPIISQHIPTLLQY